MLASNVKSSRVVIIGAGPSGIAAATRLLEAGFKKVLVLEAENRIGGRVHTLPFADNVVDLGAQWCHGEQNNVIYELVKDLGMLETTGTMYYDFISVRSNRQLVPKEVNDELKAITYTKLPNFPTDLQGCEGSLGAFLTDKYWQEIDRLPYIDRTVAHEFFENFKKFECSKESSDNLFDVSGRGNLEYWLCDGDMMLNWKEKGFKSLLQLLMKAQSDSAEDLGILNKRVLLNRRVEQITWNDNQGIKIKCWNGELITTDHLICTVSLGVLQENHEHMFKPVLPVAKCRAIAGLSLGTVNKFFMQFEVPFVPADWPAFCFLWLEEDLIELRSSELFWLESVFGFYRVSHQPRVIEGWIVGPHGRYMETLSEKNVLQGLLWLFRKFFTFPIPDPINFLRTQWYSNPNFRGSYSYRSLYTDEMRTGASDLAAPITDASGKPLLQFAGEATSTHYYSTVHGAVESGWREAQRLISYYQDQSSHL